MVVDIDPRLENDVVINYPSGNVVPVVGDISTIQIWETALKTALSKFGQLDVVVNNAGVVQRPTSSHEVDEIEFDRLFRVNVKPLLHSCKVIVPYFQERDKKKGGVFINLSSTSALRPRPTIVWYGSTKGAINTTTKGLALEYAPQNIRFNALLPALAETAM